MKQANEIAVNFDDAKPGYTKNERARVKAFVASVFQLFPNYSNELLHDDNFQAQCRIHAGNIINFQPDNYNVRLQHVKQLVAVQNMKGLLGNYRNSIQALSAAAGDMEKLEHDYSTAYPHQPKEGDLQKRIEQAKKDASEPDVARKHLDKLMKEFK